MSLDSHQLTWSFCPELYQLTYRSMNVFLITTKHFHLATLSVLLFARSNPVCALCCRHCFFHESRAFGTSNNIIRPYRQLDSSCSFVECMRLCLKRKLMGDPVERGNRVWPSSQGPLHATPIRRPASLRIRTRQVSTCRAFRLIQQIQRLIELPRALLWCRSSR